MEKINKIFTINFLGNHLMFAAISCMGFFMVNMLIDNTKSWYLYVVGLWSVLLAVQLVFTIKLSRKKK